MRNGKFLKERGKSHSGYVVEDLIPANRQVLWASPPGIGKSLLKLWEEYCIVYGAPCYGKKVTVGNVIDVDNENRLDILQYRIRKIKKGLELLGYKQQGEIDFQHYTNFLLDNDATWDKIRVEAKAMQPCLISLDHLTKFHNQNEDKANPMSRVADGINNLMSEAGSSVQVMHHFNKEDTGTFMNRLRGSTAIYANCDVACEIRTLSRTEGKLETVGIIPQPRKDITPDAFRVRIIEGKGWLQIVHDGIYKPVDDPTLDILAHKVYHIFLSDTTGEVTVNMVKSESKGFASDYEIRRCLAFMEFTKGLITSDRKGLGGGFHYALPSSPTKSKYRECPWCNRRVLGA